MATSFQRYLFIILLVLIAFHLAGPVVTPTSCCSVPAASNAAGASDCVACVLQIGVWSPQILSIGTLPESVFSPPGEPARALGFPFPFLHPPIA